MPLSGYATFRNLQHKKKGPNAKAMPLVTRRVKNAILNGHGKLVGKKSSSDWRTVDENKEGPMFTAP